MIIHDPLYQPEQNALQDGGDLDGQIMSDLEQFRARISAGPSGDCCGDPDEHAKKRAWIDRLIELTAAGLAQIGNNPAHPVPSRLDRDAWCAMNPKFREPAVLAVAMREIEKIGRYETDTVYVEKQSFHPDDWYLWSVAACQIREDNGCRVWSCWTLNLTTGSMNGGHYGLSGQDLKTVLATKKSVAVCDPKECGRNDEKEA